MNQTNEIKPKRGKRKDRSNQIQLCCLTKGCPRKKWVNRPDDIPLKAVTVYSQCPWHDPAGAKGILEIYYDKHGNEVDIFNRRLRRKPRTMS